MVYVLYTAMFQVYGCSKGVNGQWTLVYCVLSMTVVLRVFLPHD